MVNQALGDIEFPEYGLSLEIVRTIDRGKAGRANSGRWGQAEEAQPYGPRDVPRIYDSWHGGGGISQAMEAVPNGYSYAQNVVTRFPHVAMPSGLMTEVVVNISGITLGEVLDSFEQDGTLYFLAGRAAVAIGSGTDPGPITAIGDGKDFGTGITAVSAALFGGAAYVGTKGTGSTLWKKPSGGSWTNVDPDTGVTTLERRTLLTTYFASLTSPESGGAYGGWYLLAGVGNSGTGLSRTFAYVAAEPLTPGNWSSDIPILNQTYPVNALAAANRRFWALTAGTVVHIDQRNEPAPLNESYFKQPYDASRNGEFGLYHNGWLYFTHRRGIGRIRVDTGQATREDVPGWCDWTVGVSAETPVIPRRFSNFFVLDGYIGISAYNGEDSYVNLGRDRQEIGVPGPGPLAWYLGEYYLPGERITHCRVTSPSGVNPRLWLCSVDGSGNTRIRWASLPLSSSPLQEWLTQRSGGSYSGAHRWCATSSLFLSNEALGDQSARKLPYRYDLRADDLSDDATITVQARAEDGDWVEQGTINSSPRGSALPQDPLTAGHNIGFRLDFENPTNEPVILREFRARFRVRRELALTRTFVVRLGSSTYRRGGGLDDRDPEQVYQDLVRLQTRGPVQARIDGGSLLRVLVDEGITDNEDEIRALGVDVAAGVKLAKFDLIYLPSSVADLALDRVVQSADAVGPFYDDGSVYDSDAEWG